MLQNGGETNENGAAQEGSAAIDMTVSDGCVLVKCFYAACRN